MEVADDTAARRWRAIGTTVSVLATDPRVLDEAAELLRFEIEALDWVCSRFRPDSELESVHRAAGRPVRISPLLGDLVAVALEVADRTGGLVDPTVGAAICDLGYDRDFEALDQDAPAPPAAPRPAPGWRLVELDRQRRTLRLPAGVLLDLGATAKAYTADRAAALISAAAGGAGILVNLGGDIATAGGAPAGGWRVGIDRDSATPPAQVETVVAIQGGAVASSSPAVRCWRRGGRMLHHIVDPRTGDAADTPWSLVTVAGPSCVHVNAASTAAVAAGAGGLAHLRASGLPARLVPRDGSAVVTTGGWPSDTRVGRAA